MLLVSIEFPIKKGRMQEIEIQREMAVELFEGKIKPR